MKSPVKLLIAYAVFQVSSAFVAAPALSRSELGISNRNHKLHEMKMTEKPSEGKEVSDDGDDTDSTKMMEEISWRTAKLKLEEENRKRFLKRKPRKLPYLEARRWVQYNLGADTAEEFYDLVANGNLRTPYIPKQPEEYYTATGDWVSWEHFLTMDPKVAGREVPPATGRFD